MKHTRLTIIVLSICTIATSANANILENPGFENGVTEPWETVYTDGVQIPGIEWTLDETGPHTGDFCVEIGISNGTALDGVLLKQNLDSVLWQDVSEFSFWVRQDHVSAFPIDVECVLVYGNTDYPTMTRTFILGMDLETADWQKIDRTERIQRYGGICDRSWGEGKSRLVSLSVAGDPHGERFSAFDDFVLNVVPEPSSLALLAMGALGLLRRRRS